MYESFYNFKEKPFSLTPDPGFLYLGKQHREGLTMLEYGLEVHGGITVFTGEVGSGKTTLVRKILEIMDERLTVGTITNTQPQFGEFLKWVLLAFGLDYRITDKVELYQTFFDFVVEQYAKNRRTVLIIDEAQNLDLETLEELRMLYNMNLDKDQVLQLFLVGQPELLEKLQGPELRQFAQRISVHYHLKPMQLEETRNYIRHRVRVAGGNPEIFHVTACGAIHYHTGGIPRLINTVCETALVFGFAEGRKRIDSETILNVIKDKQRSGLKIFAQ